MWLFIWTPDPFFPPSKKKKPQNSQKCELVHLGIAPIPDLIWDTERQEVGKRRLRQQSEAWRSHSISPTKALQGGEPLSPSEVSPPTPERKAAVPGTLWLALWPAHGLSCWSEGPPSQVVFIMCLELQPGSTVTFKWDGLWDLAAAGAPLRPRGLRWRNLQAAGAVLNSCHLELI